MFELIEDEMPVGVLIYDKITTAVIVCVDPVKTYSRYNKDMEAGGALCHGLSILCPTDNHIPCARCISLISQHQDYEFWFIPKGYEFIIEQIENFSPIV